MKWLITLLAIICYSDGYLNLQNIDIQATSNKINAQTTYQVSFNLDASYSDIPYGFTLVMVLPSKFTVIDSVNSKPSICTLRDYTVGTDISDFTAYDSSNPQPGQCGVTADHTYTLIIPQTLSTGLKFLIGNIQNPDASYTSANTGTILFYGYNSGSTSADYQGSKSLSDGYFSPGTLTSKLFSQESVAIGAWNTYTFSFYLADNISQDGKVIFVFDSDFSLSDAGNTVVTGQINGGSSSNLGVGISGMTLTASGLFGSALAVSSGVTYITLSITQVRNLRYIGSKSIIVATATSNSEYIDKMTISAESSTSCSITYNLFRAAVKTVLTSTTISIIFQQGNYAASSTSSTNAYYIKLFIPTTFTIPSTLTCSPISGIDTSYSTLSCTNSGQGYVTTNVISQSSISIGLNLFNVITPPNSKTTDYIQIATYTLDGSKMCENTQFITFNAEPNAITVTTKTRSSAYVGDPGPYTLTFTTSTQMPQNSYIKLVLPMAQIVENTSIECYEIISGVTYSSNNVCTKSSSPADSSTYELLMTEWCSTTSTGCTLCCSSGTTLSLSIDGVVNPYYVNSNTGTSIKIYTLNPTQDGVINNVTAGLEFTPSLSAKSISSTSFTRDDDIVGQYISLEISHTSTVIYIQNTQLVYSFPTSSIFKADDNGSVQCTNLGTTNTNTPDCSTYTTNSDGSISAITVKNLCTSNCASSQTYKIKISHIQNPITVATWTNSYTVSAYYSTYLIEQGSLDASAINSLSTGQITSIKAYRSTNSIKSSITMWVSFIHPTYMKSSGVITITFPSLMVCVKTSLSVYRYSDNTAVTFTTTDDGANSITSLKITDYCSSSCSKGGNITIAMTGIKNLDYLQSITGSLSITTSDSGFNSDIGSVSDITTILAPLEAGALTEIDLHPTNPTISVTTDYRIIFTTFNDFPAGATIKVEFPSGVTPSSTSTSCTSYINLDSGLQCSVSSNILTLTNGFPSGVLGQIIVGFIASNIVNGASTTSSYGPFKISTIDTTGYLIDSGSTTFTYLAYKDTSLCSPDCATCAGSSGTQCYSCKNPSAKPILLGYSCVATCPDGYYLSSSTPLTCLSCYYTCGNCLGSQTSDCTSCESGYYMSGGSCVTPCPVGYTANSNNVCENSGSCNSPCTSCSGDPDFCLTCDPNSATPVLYPERGECVAEETPTEDYCPTGYYEDSNKICQECSTNCNDCYSSSTYCTSCPSIYVKKYFNKLDNTCVYPCPALISVQDDTNFVCDPCDSTCATCNGVNANDCLSCYSTKTEKYLTADNQCVATCPTSYYNFYDSSSSTYKCISSCSTFGYYIDSTNTFCNPCMSTCSTCSNGSTCTSCSSSTPYLNDQSICESDCQSSEYKYTENGNKKCYSTCPSGTSHYTDSSSKKWCLSTCPSGYYSATSGTAASGLSNLFCTLCDTTCATCNGGGQNNCLTCSSSYPYINENNQCVDACSSSEYIYTLNNNMKCVTSCPSGTYQLTDKTGKKWCSSSCGDGYYVQKVTDTVNNCNPCDITCQTCNGGSTTNCLTCTQQYPYLNEKNQCESSCSSNEYTYALNGVTRCYFTCPSDTYQWIDTNEKKWCTDTCPSGYYIQKVSDSVTNCNECYKTCQTCDGGEDTNCLTCSQSYPYINEDFQCEKNCSSTEYSYSLDNSLKCYTTCPSGTYNTNSSSGIASCTTSCSTGSYVNTVSTSDSTKSGDYCEPCPQDCVLCSSEAECDTCKEKNSLPNTVNTTISICYGWSPPGPATHLAGYVIYALIAETIVVAILIFISKFKNSGFFDATATILFMTSIIEFTEKLMLLIFLWVEYGPHADIFVAITGSMLIGSLLVSMIYQDLHFDSLIESSETLQVFAMKNKWTFRTVRLLSLVFGIHFLRIFYSGFMGLAISTNAKTLGNVNAFRFPLEKKSIMNLAIVCIPMLLEQAAIMALFDAETNPWQISCFGVVLNIFIEGLFLWDYFKGPWRF